MSDTDDEKKDATAPTGGAAKAAQGRRRRTRPVTIDLPPEDVKDESPAAPKAAAGAAPEAAEGPAEETHGPRGAGKPRAAQTGAAATGAAKPAAQDAPRPPGSTGHAESGRARTAPPQPTGGLSALVAAGLAGGVAALAIYAALARFGIAPMPTSTTTAPETTARIVRLETMLARMSGQEPSGAAAQMPAELATLTKRVTVLEEAVARAGKAAQADRQTVLGDMATRLGSVETAVTEMRRRLSELAARPAAASGAADLSALQARFDADLKAALQSVDQQLAPIEDALAQLRQAIADRPAPRADAGPAAALALATAGLERAADSGGPFQRELDAVAALAGTDDTIAALKPLAVAGIVTTAQLAQSFEATASRIVAAAAAARGDGLMERFIAGARTMVRVRPAGPVAGDGAGAIVARAEARLAQGDLDGAVTELKALAAPAADAAADWIARAEARLAADRLIDTLNQSAIADLARRGAEGSGSTRSPQ